MNENNYASNWKSADVIREAEIWMNSDPKNPHLAPDLFLALEAYKELRDLFVEEPVLAKPPFIIYTTSAFRCPYCVRAKTVLTEAGYTYVERDIADPAVKAEMLERRPSARTVPQIFLNNGYYIGGCDDLISMMGTALLGLLIEANT